MIRIGCIQLLMTLTVSAHADEHGHHGNPADLDAYAAS